MRHSETFDEGGSYYPEDGIRGELEGRTKVRVERDESGTPADCTILESSGHDTLDAQTCKLVGTDPNFTPAQEDGRAADFKDPITQTIVWRLPVEPAAAGQGVAPSPPPTPMERSR